MPVLLQINVVSNYGATGRISNDIGEFAISNGWKSYIAFGRKKRPSKSELIKIGNWFVILRHVLITRLFDKHGFGSKKATLNLIESIIKIKPDIIHIHNIHGYFINIEVLFDYLSNSNIPVVWTLHDCWPFTGHCTYFDFEGCNKWKDGCYDCPQKTKYPTSLLIDNSKQNYLDKKILFNSVSKLNIVAVSNWIGNITGKSFLKNHPLKIINNGVDLNVFYPKENNNYIINKLNNKNSFILLGVASEWQERKGLNDFIKLSKLISEEIIIVLVGLNVSQIKDLPSNIIGIKRTENISQLVEIYSAADVFLNLTYEDNFPTTNIEALACGIPVITYNTGGSIEAVSENTGFIVDKGDFNSIIDKIKIVKEKGKKYYSKTCRKRSEELYDVKDRYKEYLDLYTNLINSQ